MEIMVYLILAIPVASLVWLIVSIVRFCKTDKENHKERVQFRNQIIISSIIIVLWILAVFGFIAWLAYSITVYGM